MLEPAFSLPSLIEAERKHLLSQRKKAYSLIFLMIMLAQTSYIGALEGWSLHTELEEEHEEPLRVDSPTVCAATSRSSGTAIYVDVTEGDDAYPGTTNCPKASLGAAVTLATSEAASNPEIVLHAGLYHENVSINNLDNLLIRAADGDRVVFDGTRSISDDLGGVWGSADSDGIQEVTLTEDGWQLFLAHEEQVPARWPNAGFDDETVFNRSYWAEGILTNSNNAYTKGWLTDAGPEAGVHTGLNETVNASGLDPVGAIAVMNLGSFRSNSRIITDWNPNNGTFAYDADGVGWKTKHHAYFLEGKRELIDVDGEWWYNNTNNRLHYKTPSGQDANDLDLRVKVQPFAISVDGSDGVTIQGIDFFGTTVNFNNCDGCSFTNSTLEYPSTSKRGLGIAGESEDDRWMTRFYRSMNSFVDRISITNTDGGAIEFQGSPGQSNNNTVNNSYFHAIDWSAADQKGLMVTIYEGGRDMYFTNNSVHLTGASSVLSIGDAPKVFYNEVWDVGHLQTDGAVVQVMQGEAPGSIIAYNWIHDIIKYGARFDAPIGQAGEGRNGTMHHNVIWNAAGGLMVKGDYHDIHNNTVFNSTGKNDMIILTDGGVNNGNSTIHQNAADKMADHRSDSWSLYPLPAGTYWNNWNGYVNTTDSVWNQLVDPANRDFRPKVNSHLSNMSAGAYDAGVSNPWTAGISWTYTTPNAPVAGCMLDYADNYNAEATLSDGSCLFASYSPPSTLDLRLHLDPTNSSSYSGSGTDLVDLSTYGNDGTIDGAEWEANRTRFYYDGSCSGATAPPNQAGTYVCDEVTLAETNDHDPDANGDWSVSVWINATTVQHSVIIGKWNSGGSASDLGYIIRIGSDNKLYTSVGTTSGSSAVSTPRISIDEDHWYHLVMVADAGNILRLYADGVNVANASLLGSGSIRNTTSGISIGSYNAGEYNQPFDGNIGEVMIFADALNSTTINQMYKAGKGVYSNTTNLSYAQTSSTMLLGQTYSFPITATNGELTTSYSLTGTLPTGMNFESSNGTIWGTPTVAMTSTTYTLTANNSAGSYSTSISLTSQHVAPYDLVYSPENMMFTKGTAITPNFPSVSGGTVTSWEISPSLPTGLTWGTTDGKISGTPTALQTIATTYTIWANNSGGSASIQVNITVNDEAPDISYSPDWFVLTNNTAMSPTVTPTNSGGAIPSAIIDSTGNIGQHTSIAIDSNGFKHISYFDYSNQDLEYATDKSGSWVTHSVETTGNVGYYTSIAVDSNDNVHISYFDNTNDDLKYATDKSGSWVTTSVDTSGHVGSWTSIAIDSNDAVHISYYDSTNDDLKYATCSSGCATASNWNDVSVRTAGNVGSWNSIAIDSTDAVHISYRDSTNNNLKYATCSSGCTSASNWNDVTVDTGNVGHYTSIAIDSNDAVHISYYDLAHKDLKYATCSSGCTTASNWNDVSVDTAGYVGSYTSIAIDSNDAVHISYRDSTIDDLKYATCSSGCTTASNWNDVAVDTDNVGHYTSIAIDSNDAVHISYYDLANDDLKYTALDSSSNILGYSVSPALPEGLEMNINTGEISGTPTALSTNTTYTITVGNSGGMNTTTITILVNDQVPNALGYTLENMTLEKGTAMTTNTPSVSGGAVTSWEIDPSLPSGLSFGSANGSIWGTPTILQTTTVAYTIWANNSGGSESAQVNITINDQIASISYTSPVDISNNRLLSTITPTTSGGAITSWEITPSLPTGLTFGTTNGSIWGTPENVTSNATYTIYANNSGGSASATLTLNVNWTLTPSADGAYITRNSSIGTDITWEWDYDPLESSNLTMYASWRNTCAIRDDGDVYCWGRNGNGQIGNGNMGSSQHKDRPTKTNNLGSDAISVSIGEQHTCAVLDTGVLKCWGRNNNGQIGNGGGGDVSSPTNVNLGSGRTATSVYLGFHHTCAILDDQSVKCWGRNQDGELGVGSTTNSFNTPQSINSLGTNRHAVSLALGEGFTCALLDDGSVKCWGQDNEGQRGDGGLYGSDIRSPPSSVISLPAGRTATQISAGQFHVCALLDDASVVCWGKNANGQLGDGSTTDRQAPVATSSFGSGHSVSYISAGYDHTCALLTDGGVRCWGSNGNGQLGDGSKNDRSTPSSTDINLGSGYTSIGISAGGGHTCAMLNDGDMKCWGASGSGQLGNNAGL
jgi:alpha-tubulin suppressor-like RCC1 family protein